ncbi:hypothetical protein RUK45_003421, partial [Vibrio cholerae]|nr:hypothetical protein [Vibrio cholerae]
LIKLTYLIVICFFTVPTYAIDFWHSNTTWAGQGQCSAVFSFDSGVEEIIELKLLVSAFNKEGEKVASGLIEVPHFGQSTADRYIDVSLEDEAFCDEDITIVVTNAEAVIDGNNTDLLKKKLISTREFKPFNIIVDKRY